jgi:predicted DNA-binding transcriptional regulator YafY
VERLDRLAARLKADELLTLGVLAAEFGTSVRTLSRDVALLRAQGLPVETDRGRGGGIRLHWSWGIGRLKLSYQEAVDLLVSLAIAEQMRSPLLMANLAPIRRKLMASFSPALRDRIDTLRARILIGQSASPFVLAAFAEPDEEVVRRLHRAFVAMHALDITYRRGDGQTSARRIEPHVLFLNYPIWYVVAWDRSRDAVRTFRCDRIVSAEVVAEDNFERRPLHAFREALDGAEAMEP